MMFARTNIVQFKPDTFDTATQFVKEIMLPSASKQQGFQGAFFLKHEQDPSKYIIISMWDTEADLLASGPPEEIIPELEAFGELLADSKQDIYEVLLHQEKGQG